MIQNDHELAVSQKKLAVLEATMKELKALPRNDPVREACLIGISNLIKQFTEEILRYGAGQRGKEFLRRALKTPSEAQNTRVKLAGLEDLIRQKSHPTSRVERLSLSALRHTRNELKEQLLWYEAKHTRGAVSATR